RHLNKGRFLQIIHFSFLGNKVLLGFHITKNSNTLLFSQPLNIIAQGNRPVKNEYPPCTT
ncbi:MAG: hypothetical protein WCJ01_11520, partial [Ignavibacteria bacterium]